MKRPCSSNIADPRIYRIQSALQDSPRNRIQRPRRTQRGPRHTQHGQSVIQRSIPVQNSTEDEFVANSCQVGPQIVLPGCTTVETPGAPNDYIYPMTAAIDQYNPLSNQRLSLQKLSAHDPQMWTVGPGVSPSNRLPLVSQTKDDKAILIEYSRYTCGPLPQVIYWPESGSDAHIQSTLLSGAHWNMHSRQDDPFAQAKVPVAATDELIGVGLYDTPEQVQSASRASSNLPAIRRRSLKLEAAFDPVVAVELGTEADTSAVAWFPAADATFHHHAQYVYSPSIMSSQYDHTYLLQCGNSVPTQPFQCPPPQGLYGYS